MRVRDDQNRLPTEVQRLRHPVDEADQLKAEINLQRELTHKQQVALALGSGKACREPNDWSKSIAGAVLKPGFTQSFCQIL